MSKRYLAALEARCSRPSDCISDAEYFRQNPHARFRARHWDVRDIINPYHDAANGAEAWITIVLPDGRRHSSPGWPEPRGPHWRKRVHRWAEAIALWLASAPIERWWEETGPPPRVILLPWHPSPLAQTERHWCEVVS